MLSSWHLQRFGYGGQPAYRKSRSTSALRRRIKSITRLGGFAALLLFTISLSRAYQLGPKNEPPAMGSSYQPLLWQGDDAQFALDAARAGKCQVERDALVGSRSSDADVRELASHSLGLHSRAYKRLHAMAKTIGFKLDSKKNAPECPDTARLRSLTGDAFDRLYLTTLAATNQREISGYSTELQAAPNSANYELKRFAASNLPLLNEQKLKVAELRKRYGPAGR